LRSSNTFRDRWPGLFGVSCWLLPIVGLFAQSAQAVDPARAISQYVRDRWGPDQGFPRGPVYAISQTPDGYLWIGTEAGLVRFDGLNFRLIKEKMAPVGSVLGLTADSDGNVWVRPPGPTLLRYRDGIFTDAMTTLGMPYSNVTVMSRSRDGGLLVARLEDGAVLYRGGKFETIAVATPLARSPVLSVAQTSDGDVWMGTRDAGLFRVSKNHVAAVVNGLPDLKINCLLPDGDGRLWVGTDGGIALWDGSRLTSGGIPEAINHSQALALLKDRDGNIWVGTDAHGLIRINTYGTAYLNRANGSSAAVTALFEDREGNLWIGSSSGIERLRDSAFVTYSLPEGLPTNGSNPVFADSEGRVWFPPVEGGLWWLKDGKHGQVTAGGLDGDVVYSIAGGKGELWLGRQRGGLTRLSLASGFANAKTYTRADGLAHDSVYSVYQARDGTVWAGTLGGGVSKFQEGKFTTYTTADGLASNTVASMLESADGTMWFATPTGLSALSKGQWRSYAVGDGLPSANVNSLLEDSEGVLWVGTAGGLAFHGANGIESRAAMHASMREQILGIGEDRDGWLWMTTSSHVIRVRRDKLMHGSLEDGDLRDYGLADGLRGVEGVKRHQSLVRDSRGRMWLSMNLGISMVDPARLTSSTPAIVRIHTISADGTPVDLRGPARIPGGKQRIALQYDGLSLSVPERVRFRYRLDGFDRAWNEPVAAREATYTNLGPGPYRFRVIASNPDGIWNSAETNVEFEIAPLFWQTWWFQLGSVLAVAFAIAAAYRYRLHELTRQLNVRFEERLAERTRIAQELHDTLLQGFLSASMQLHVATDRVAEDSPAKPALNRVLGLMGQVIEEGRNAVRGLRSSQSNSFDLEQAFCQIQRELAVGDRVEFRVITEGQPRPLHPVFRDEMYRIGREALVNAFRHSKADSIEVEIDYEAKQFRLLVRDNGCGIDAAVLKSGREGHWGLPGMRERAESIGAQLNVWSSAAAGTEVVLSVPGQIAYQSGVAKGRWKWMAGLKSRKNSENE
jgi:signal transduction histidine kinase/ligand-binding sensor domain-containing protein